jgi:hypothetical protein
VSPTIDETAMRVEKNISVEDEAKVGVGGSSEGMREKQSRQASCLI